MRRQFTRCEWTMSHCDSFQTGLRRHHEIGFSRLFYDLCQRMRLGYVEYYHFAGDVIESYGMKDDTDRESRCPIEIGGR